MRKIIKGARIYRLGYKKFIWDDMSNSYEVDLGIHRGVMRKSYRIIHKFNLYFFYFAFFKFLKINNFFLKKI